MKSEGSLTGPQEKSDLSEKCMDVRENTDRREPFRKTETKYTVETERTETEG